MDDFNFWWYIIAAVLYFLTSRKKKKSPANPNRKNRPQKSTQPKSFEDLLREITEGPSEQYEEPKQDPIEVTRPSSESVKAEEQRKEIRLEGERRHFSDEESRKVYEESIKMAEGAELEFGAAEGYANPRIFKGLTADEEEEEWTIADEIRDGLSSSEARKAIIYSEILNRKY